jgi:HNH endonuclease
MPARKKTPGRKQIIQAIRKAAQKLGHAPIQAEFVRLSGIELRAVKRYFLRFPSAVRAAGLRTQAGQKLESAEILQNWGEVVRKLGHTPSYTEYGEEGRYGATIFQRRFGGWSHVGEAFLRFVETGSLPGKWEDVIQAIRKCAVAAATEESWPYEKPRYHVPAMRQIVPEELAGKRCVTATMMSVFLAQVTGTELQWWSTGEIFKRRVLPDRPLLGPPMRRMSMSHEPVNEMGVVMLFSMYAERLGFVIEFAQVRFPDCKAKLEVEPGRWQDVNVEFELNSSNFVEHGHDPDKTDVIICWKHDWAECPERIMVLELSKLVKG